MILGTIPTNSRFFNISLQLETSRAETQKWLVGELTTDEHGLTQMSYRSKPPIRANPPNPQRSARDWGLCKKQLKT